MPHGAPPSRSTTRSDSRSESAENEYRKKSSRKGPTPSDPKTKTSRKGSSQPGWFNSIGLEGQALSTRNASRYKRGPGESIK